MARWPGWAQNFVRAIIGNAEGPIEADNPLQVELQGGSATIGTVNQGTPNVGGALAWPVSDAAVLTALAAGLPAALGAGGGLKADGTGSAGTPAAGVSTVQGIAGGKPVNATLDNDWNYTPTSTTAGNNFTNLQLVGAGAAGTVRYLSMYSVVVKTASPTADIIVRLLNGSGGAVIWEDVIGAGSPVGTRVGFAQARGIPVSVDTGIFLTTTGNTGSPLLTSSAAGYTK